MTSSELALRKEVREAVVRVTGLDIRPEDLAFDQPLIDGDWPLDSVDLVACVVCIEHMYGIEFSDDATLSEEFRTIDTITAAVTRLRGTGEAAAPGRAARGRI
jgi:acyl carrier protein